jgi:glycosyltransferase involved in cell wall biosynthesis
MSNLTTETTRPEISVIIPVYNGGTVFGECIKRLLDSDFRSFEIIISDDGSTDGSLEIARKAGLQVLSSPVRQGAAAARNAAAAVARGEIFFFTDSDVWVSNDTLSKMILPFRNDPTLDASIGSYASKVPHKDVWSRFKNIHHHYIHQVSRTDAITFWTGCGMVRREAFFAVGGFDLSFRGATIEDIEMGYRLSKAGRRILLNKEAQVTHAKRYTLLSLLKSDILHRAVPWTVLMLSERTFRSDLNTTWANAVCIMLAWLSLIVPWTAFFYGWIPLVVTGALLALFILLNCHFYRYISKRESMGLLLRWYP